jgi:polysaccharide export outer membrane protein
VAAATMPAYAQGGAFDERLKALTALPRNDAEYRLGPGDLVEIGVFGVNDFNHTLRVSASGVVKLPLLEPVTAAGLTAAELEQQLTVLLSADVIKNPQVSVFVKEYRSQPVMVLGAVRSPGQYQIQLQLKIVDVLSMAGGLQASAVDEAVIQRSVPGGKEEIIKVNLRELLEEGNLALNVVVRGGDVIHIRERVPETVYVIGEVNRAGPVAIPAKQELRVSQVFAYAGGPMKTAKLDKAILVRYQEDGTRQELAVNVSEILKGKQEDFMVKANDVIFVPGSKFKDIGYGLLSIIPGSLGNVPFLIP